MEFTFLSIPVFSLTLIFLLLKPEYLVYLFVFFMPFCASAVINFTGITFGLQPAYFLGLVLMAFWVLNQLKRDFRFRFSRLNYPLIFFGLWATVGMVFPFLFENVCKVYTPEGTYRLLQFSRLNITQLAYLWFFICVVIYLTDLFSRSPSTMHHAIQVFIFSGMVAIFWGWFQFISVVFHLPYPDWIFNNSLSFHQLWYRCFGPVPRVSSVCPEASMYHHFLAAYLPLLFYAGFSPSFNQHKRTLYVFRLFFFLGVLQVLTSTSTSGYVALAILLFFLLKKGLSFTLQGRFLISKTLICFLWIFIPSFFIVIIVALNVIDPSMRNVIVGETITNKVTSYSGIERKWMAMMGLNALISTSFLGAGWGSLRSTDLGTNLLGQTGIIGLGLLLYWFRIVRRNARQGLMALKKRSEPSYPLYYGLYLGWIICMIINLISIPDIIFLYLAFLWAVFVSIMAKPNLLQQMHRNQLYEKDCQENCSLF